MSTTLRKWVRDYIESKIKATWRIVEIATFTAEKSTHYWEVYVRLQEKDGSEWTNGNMRFDFYGRCIQEGIIGDLWKKKEKVDLLLKELGYEYIPEYTMEIPAHLIKQTIKRKKIKKRNDRKTH